MIEDRCRTCGVIIAGATRKRFEETYDTHQKAVHEKPAVAKRGTR